MKQPQFDEMIGRFGKGWAELKPNDVMSLIARDNLRYYESTFSEPTTDWGKVDALWQVIPNNQNNVTWWHEILVSDNQMALAHVKVTRIMSSNNERQDIDAAFLFGFNEQGLINYFRQWRMLR